MCWLCWHVLLCATAACAGACLAGGIARSSIKVPGAASAAVIGAAAAAAGAAVGAAVLVAVGAAVLVAVGAAVAAAAGAAAAAAVGAAEAVPLGSLFVALLMALSKSKFSQSSSGPKRSSPSVSVAVFCFLFEPLEFSGFSLQLCKLLFLECPPCSD